MSYEDWWNKTREDRGFHAAVKYMCDLLADIHPGEWKIFQDFGVDDCVLAPNQNGPFLILGLNTNGHTGPRIGAAHEHANGWEFSWWRTIEFNSDQQIRNMAALIISVWSVIPRLRKIDREEINIEEARIIIADFFNALVPNAELRIGRT